ncbi:NADH:flavin oxidoreductase/NADH oxidase [Roseomonas xinghualingensis]|uniref:NADH:flavin oxidoreductase/NADH oxidase n=1 Tax=Roseomonas xinghualingensis TaxID=2986475 RepID=UPI0021F0E7F6|nr:NADH:flavin oxidoreductase/NADH oxidase [Roseomonas sp. SXEYE001]MCV4206399.1 NADH:flavin oxidoreductase/NADH oxidase [Roseomonas sp. SXEYE001]
MTDLFEPLTLRGVTLRNRIGLAPMCQYCCGPDGRPTDWHLAHLLQRAIGGAGLILTEATAVTAEGRITPADLGLWEEAQVAGHARLVSAITAAGAVPGIQLAHAGRKASRNPPWVHGAAQPGWEAIGPSALAMDGMLVPRAMAESEIADTITAFVAAARRAVRVGYRVVELHAAHGYLLHQFLSPLSNTREDSWGGDFEGRTRLVRETAAALRDALPADIALFLRISHTDWAEGGWTTAESVELARRVAPLGVDLIDVSSGGITNRQEIPLGPGYQVPGAEAVRGTGIPVAAVGLIDDAEQAQTILTEGKADMVLLARAMLRDPYWPIRAAQALGRTDRLAIPPQYERGWGNLPMRQETAEPMPTL